MSDWTEYSPPSSSKSNSILSGHLRRSGRAGKTLGLRQKRFYKLDGAIFSKHLTETSSAIWDINVQGAQIGRLGRCNFGIRLNNLEHRAAKDFQNNLIVLYSRSEEECNVWVSALRNASQRKLEDYYDVMELIGEGGFAKVRLGRCLANNQKCAIKTMNKAEAHAKVLGTEVAVIKRVDHPNIVKTFDIFETSEQIHIVMEYMEGGMLYDAIEDGVHFDEADVIQFLREILDGLLYLHEVGIVHRDIKPENVLCTSKNTPLHVKIADFGLSSISTVADMKANRMLMSTMIGTPEFVAPEIARQETYTEKVDMWAMGMLCYNVIARRLPLDESRDMLQQIQEGITLTFPESEWENYSPLAKSFVCSLLCTDPEKRLSPLGCLTHRWVQSAAPEQSTKFAAHGRMSNLLLAPSAQQIRAMNRYREFNAKKTWRKIYLSVNALCKLTNCTGINIFDSANLRAISIAPDRRLVGIASKTSHDCISDSSDASLQIPIHHRMSSIATSNSTLGESEDNARKDDGLSEGYGRNSSHRKPVKIANGPNTTFDTASSSHQHFESPNLHLSHSADLELGFNDAEIGDDECKAPNSFNWREKIPVSNSTVIGFNPSSTRILRFPNWKKNRGAATPNGDGPKTDFTDLKAVRKLNHVLSKKVHVRNGNGHGGNANLSGADAFHEKQSHHQNQFAEDAHDPTDEQGGSSLVASSTGHTPWRSSGTVANIENGNNALIRSKSSHSNKPSLRKRILHTLTGESAKNAAGNNSPFRGPKGKGEGAMNKLRMLMRKTDNNSRPGSGSVNGSAARGAAEKSNNRIGPMETFCPTSTEIGFHEDQDDYYVQGVKTFDFASFKHLYSDEDSIGQLNVAKKTNLNKPKGGGHALGRTGSGPAPNIHPHYQDRHVMNTSTHANMSTPTRKKSTHEKISWGDKILDRMSPLTPSTAEVAKRGQFDK